MAAMPPRPGFPTSDSQVQDMVDGEVELEPHISDTKSAEAKEGGEASRPNFGSSGGASQGHIRKSKSGLGALFSHLCSKA